MIPTEILNMIAQFMQRVDLKGAEVEAYVTCMQTLQEAIKAPPTPPTEEDSE